MFAILVTTWKYSTSPVSPEPVERKVYGPFGTRQEADYAVSDWAESNAEAHAPHEPGTTYDIVEFFTP